MQESLTHRSQMFWMRCTNERYYYSIQHYIIQTVDGSCSLSALTLCYCCCIAASYGGVTECCSIPRRAVCAFLNNTVYPCSNALIQCLRAKHKIRLHRRGSCRIFSEYHRPLHDFFFAPGCVRKILQTFSEWEKCWRITFRFSLLPIGSLLSRRGYVTLFWDE